MTTRFAGGLRLLLRVAPIAVLCGCAAHTASAPPAAVPTMAEDAEPLPSGITPLTLEQEQAFDDGDQ